MRRAISFCLLFGSFFAIFNCSKQTNAIDVKPSPVRLVQMSGDDVEIERGIDAVSDKDAIRIEWMPNDEDDVAGYEIYRSLDDKNGQYNQLIAYPALSVADSAYVDEGVLLQHRYFYYLVAVTFDRVRSEPSDTVDYQIISKAINLLPQGDGANRKPEFSWEDPNGEDGYRIRVIDPASDETIWISSLIASTYSNREQVDYNFDSKATMDSLQSGAEYHWRVDVISAKTHCGSESRWVTFRVQ